MRSPELRFRCSVDAHTRDAITAAVATHGMLDRVVRWGLTRSPPKKIVEVVVQDEYTHDVVLRWSSSLYLVYDCT